MRPYVSGQANLFPPKRVKQLRRLLETQSPNICIIRGEGIGDVLMTTPTVEALKNTFPEKANITYTTNTRYLDGGLVKVLKYNPFVDRVIDRNEVDESDYDLVINLHCPCVGYEKRENLPINRIDLFAAHAGVKLENKVPRYYIQTSEIEWGNTFFSKNKIKSTDKTILVHIFTTTTRRNLNSGVFKSALMDLSRKGYKLIILSHSTDYPSDVLFSNIPNSVYIKDEDIRNIASIMVKSDLLLCPDSCMLHLAGALSVPTVSIFGHTDPRARINYYSNTVAIWGAERMSCKNCWSLPCPNKEACYKVITKDMIVGTCENMIQGKPSELKVEDASQDEAIISIERI
jgi:ADP-heptose:LPS heptosyltransferase